MRYSSKIIERIMRKTGCILSVQPDKQCKEKIPNFYLIEKFSGGELYKQLETLHHPYTIFHLQITICVLSTVDFPF